MLDKPFMQGYTGVMILKNGESLVHLKARIKKEMSELDTEDALMYRDEAVRDIFNAAMDQKIPVNEARTLIESLDPEFYSKPNELRKSAMTEVYVTGAATVFAGIVGVICLGLFMAVIFSF
jgi:hypothetical protein